MGMHGGLDGPGGLDCRICHMLEGKYAKSVPGSYCTRTDWGRSRSARDEIPRWKQSSHTELDSSESVNWLEKAIA